MDVIAMSAVAVVVAIAGILLIAAILVSRRCPRCRRFAGLQRFIAVPPVDYHECRHCGARIARTRVSGRWRYIGEEEWATRIAPFNGMSFSLGPAERRSTVAEPEELHRVAEILDRSGFMEHLPAHRIVRVEVGDPVPAGTPLWRAHGTWTESYLPNVSTPEGFPRQDDAALCPPGLVRVAVCCVNRQTGGMGAQFGFAGTYFGVLVSPRHRDLWDVRGEAVQS